MSMSCVQGGRTVFSFHDSRKWRCRSFTPLPTSFRTSRPYAKVLVPKLVHQLRTRRSTSSPSTFVPRSGSASTRVICRYAPSPETISSRGMTDDLSSDANGCRLSILSTNVADEEESEGWR